MTDAETTPGRGEAAAEPTGGESDGYRGVFGAFPYAFRAADSLLFRSYVVVGGLAAAALSVLFVLALIALFGATAGARFSIVRAFYVLVGLGAVAPTVAPVLLVARSCRRNIQRRSGYEAGLAVAGYVFLASLYAGAVVGAGRTPLAPAAGLWLPVAGAALVAAVHRLRG